MHPFKHWKLWIITGSAMLGSVYGLFVTLSLNQPDLSLVRLMIPVVNGAALCASAASGLCRMFETLKYIRESQNRPSDHTLCYRGIRHLAPSCQEVFQGSTAHVSDGVTDEEIRADRDRQSP